MPNSAREDHSCGLRLKERERKSEKWEHKEEEPTWGSENGSVDDDDGDGRIAVEWRNRWRERERR